MEQQTGKRSFGERAGNLGRATWKHRAIYTLLIPGPICPWVGSPWPLSSTRRT